MPDNHCGNAEGGRRKIIPRTENFIQQMLRTPSSRKILANSRSKQEENEEYVGPYSLGERH